MTELERTIIATVRKPHGVKGSLKVTLHGLELADVKELKTLFLKTDSGWQSYELSLVQGTNSDAILTLGGVDSREAVELLRGQDLYADDADLPPLEELEFYIEDLEGCEVADSEGTIFGKVTEILLGNEQDTLVVLSADGIESMFPFVDEWIEEVDIEGRRIIVTPSEIR
ncbi:MAG TPA: 16S rRNA processing protein RimM [Candidatus Marinimicrobia bacterium]|nr:16S rRNA processing protein RimM [Candidatus Neomarinimicrobiota bacterium]